MGDVKAVCTLECAHRRHLLAARALNERSLLLRGLPFPRTKTIGDVYFDDLVILNCFALFRRACRFIAPRSVASRCLERFPPNTYMCGKVGRYIRGRVLGRTPRRRRRHTRFPSRTDDASCCYRGKSDTPPTPPRRVGIRPHVPARGICSPRLQPCLWLQAGEGLAPVLETNLRAEPCEKLYATDASPDGAGGFAASITQDDWLDLYGTPLPAHKVDDWRCIHPCQSQCFAIFRRAWRFVAHRSATCRRFV